MTTSLTQAQEKKRAAAFKKFIDRAWTEGVDADDLLALAETAGINAAAADRIIREIGAAQADVALAKTLKGVKPKATSTRKTFEETKAKNTPEIERLEGEIEDAGIAADAAQQAVHAVENAARRVLALYDKGLVPGRHVPTAVLDARDRRAREAKIAELDGKRGAAKKHVAECEAEIRQAERKVDQCHDLRDTGPHKAKLAAAKKKLEAARAALSAAEAALEKAKKT